VKSSRSSSKVEVEGGGGGKYLATEGGVNWVTGDEDEEELVFVFDGGPLEPDFIEIGLGLGLGLVVGVGVRIGVVVVVVVGGGGGF